MTDASTIVLLILTYLAAPWLIVGSRLFYRMHDLVRRGRTDVLDGEWCGEVTDGMIDGMEDDPKEWQRIIGWAPPWPGRVLGVMLWPFYILSMLRLVDYQFNEYERKSAPFRTYLPEETDDDQSD